MSYAHNPLDSRFRSIFLSRLLHQILLAIALMVCVSGANAQYGYGLAWWGQWSPCDANGNLLPQGKANSDGCINLTGTLNSSASNFYPSDFGTFAKYADLTAPAYKQPYPRGWWITSTYNPNEIFDSWQYGGGPVDAASSFWYQEYPGTAAYAKAGNLAQDISSANGGTFPFFSQGGAASPGEAINGSSGANVNVALAAYFR